MKAACGSMVRYHKDLPARVYQHPVIYFCLPACLEDFERCPECSCLSRLSAGI